MGTVLIRKRLLLFIVLAIVALLAGWWIYARYFAPEPTYPLGEKLEYIGATYSGTVPFLSDNKPSASYYYATDMTPEEVVKYFPRASIDNMEDLKNTFPPITFSLTTPNNNNPIHIYYYPDPSSKSRIKKFNLRSSGKKHLLIIQDEDYLAAKASL